MGAGVVKEAGSNKDSRRPGRGPCLQVFCFFLQRISHVPLVRYSTPGLHENDCRTLFAKSTVCNGHLSVWSVSTESRCAALQEAQGGNSYLTCTADRLQLTERCHFRGGRSVADCTNAQKMSDKDRGLVTRTSGLAACARYVFIQTTLCR